MRLRRLQISAFGSLHERIVEFGDGITVLLGPNEAGKSTVLHCLAQVLYGKPSQRSLFPDLTPWAGGDFAAELEMEQDGLRYRLLRRFAESGSRAVSLVQLRDDGSERLVTREAGEVRNWVAEALGTGDDRIFYRVFCLTQADLHPLDNFGGLREQLERVAGGAEVAVTVAIQRVDARLAILRRGVGQPALSQNWGALKRASEALRDWETRLHDARRQQKRLVDVRERMQAIQASLGTATIRSEQVTGLLEQERTRRELTARLESLRAEWTNLEQSRERMTRLSAERDRLQERLAALPPVYRNTEKARQRVLAANTDRRTAAVAGWLLLASAVALLIMRIVSAKPPEWLAYGIALGAVVGLPLVFRHFAGVLRQARLRVEFGVSRLADALQRLDEAENDGREYAALQLAWDAVNGTGEGSDRRRELAREIAVQEEKIAQIPGQLLTAEEGHRLSAEQQILRAALPGWQEEERALLRELAVLEDAERDLIDLEDGVAYWRQEEARAREEEQALLLARELLRESGEQAHGAISAPLTACISPLFAGMTGGRYPQVRVTGDANTFDVHPLDAAGTPIPPDQLSRGTRDQFMLAVRLALGQVIAGQAGTPLFLLDDPLLHFDEDRRRDALSMLNQLSTRAQIILATHDESLLADLPDITVVRL